MGKVPGMERVWPARNKDGIKRKKDDWLMKRAGLYTSMNLGRKKEQRRAYE